jgi:hypothetical protein
VRIELGPLPSSGARLWIAYARTALAEMLASRQPDLAQIDPAALEMLEAVLDDWDLSAAQAGELQWQVDLPEKALWRLTGAWALLVEQLAAQEERRGYEIAPPEGEGFVEAASAAMQGAIEKQRSGPRRPGLVALRDDRGQSVA